MADAGVGHMKISWFAALVMCVLSFVAFGVILMFARETHARRITVSMGVTAFMAFVSALMVITS